MLFPSLSVGPSKFGVVAKVRAPVDELILNSAASVPDFDQVSVAPASSSLPAYAIPIAVASVCEIG